MFRNWSGESNDSIQPTWIDHLVSSNPHGVMQVLQRNGYSGYLAPQNNEELVDASYDFVQREGEEAVIQLLKSHPLYGAISDVATEQKQVRFNFRNADGVFSSVLTTIQTMDVRKLIETFLVLVGVFFVADKLWKYISK